MKNIILFILLIIVISVTSCKICPEINTSSTVDTSYIIRNAQREVHIQDSIAFELRVDSLMEIFNRALFQASQPDVDFTPTTIATKKKGGTTANVRLYKDSLNHLQLTIDLLTDSIHNINTKDSIPVIIQKDRVVVKECQFNWSPFKHKLFEVLAYIGGITILIATCYFVFRKRFS